MTIDPAQPWGIAIDYFGRATVTEAGHTVQVRIYDQTLGGPLAPDPVTGQYPAVYVSAQVHESGAGDAQLFGLGDVLINPTGPGPVLPDQTSVPAAVAAALADFQARTAAFAELCAAWAPVETPPGDGGDGGDPPDGNDSGDGGAAPDPAA